LSPFGGSTRRGRVDIILFLAQSTSTLRAPPPKEDSEAGCKILHPALRVPPTKLKYGRDKPSATEARNKLSTSLPTAGREVNYKLFVYYVII